MKWFILISDFGETMTRFLGGKCLYWWNIHIYLYKFSEGYEIIDEVMISRMCLGIDVEIYWLLVYDYFFNYWEHYIILLLRYWYFEEVNKCHGWHDDIWLIVEWNINKNMIFWELKWVVVIVGTRCVHKNVRLLSLGTLWALSWCTEMYCYCL